MSTSHYISKKTTAILSVVFFLIPAWFFAVWARLGWKDPEMDVDDKVRIYLSYFPRFLQSVGRIHYISIVCCIMAIIVSAYAYKQHYLYIKILMMLIVLFSFFMLVFNIYQMV